MRLNKQFLPFLLDQLLAEQLKDKKEKIQKGIREVTDDLVMLAEACSGEYHRRDDDVDPYI